MIQSSLTITMINWRHIEKSSNICTTIHQNIFQPASKGHRDVIFVYCSEKSKLIFIFSVHLLNQIRNMKVVENISAVFNPTHPLTLQAVAHNQQVEILKSIVCFYLFEQFIFEIICQRLFVNCRAEYQCCSNSKPIDFLLEEDFQKTKLILIYFKLPFLQ